MFLASTSLCVLTVFGILSFPRRVSCVALEGSRSGVAVNLTLAGAPSRLPRARLVSRQTPVSVENTPSEPHLKFFRRELEESDERETFKGSPSDVGVQRKPEYHKQAPPPPNYPHEKAHAYENDTGKTYPHAKAHAYEKDTDKHTGVSSDARLFGGGWWIVLLVSVHWMLFGIASVVWKQTRGSHLSPQTDDSQMGFSYMWVGSTLRALFGVGACGQFLALFAVLCSNLADLDDTDQVAWEERSHVFVFLWLVNVAFAALLKANFGRLNVFFLSPTDDLLAADLIAMFPSGASATADLELFKVDREERCFFRNCLRWVYHDDQRSFAPRARRPTDHPFLEKASLASCAGMSPEEAATRLRSEGKNEILVDVPSFAAALSLELVSWGSIYQISMFFAALYKKNFPFALIMFILISSASVLKASLVRNSSARIEALAGIRASVAVKRGNAWTSIDATELVVGDLVSIEEGSMVPADIVLVEGTAVMDEAALTGEAMPVQKYAKPAVAGEDIGLSAAKHLLSTGTYALPSGSFDPQRGSGDEPSNVGVVVAVGASTSRGILIRDILSPKVVRHKYHEEMPLVLAFLAMFAFILLAIQLSRARSGSPGMDFQVGIATVMQLLNPLLPAALLVGEAAACRRLQNEQSVYCIAPSLVVHAGRIRVFCFDKTGTLTNEGLQLLGAHEASKKSGARPVFNTVTDLGRGNRYSLIHEQRAEGERGRRQSDLGADTEESLQVSSILRLGMASCHSVTIVDGKTIGNPAEIEMFTRSGWQIEPASVAGRKRQEDDETVKRVISCEQTGETCEVLQLFEFDHERMTSSVAVSAQSKQYVFCKGAYEPFAHRLSPDTMPEDYLKTCELHAKRGCYVLAIGYKEIGSRGEAQSLKRDDAESGLQLLGLVLFRNEPKADSADAMTSLREGAIRLVILTGDNVLTGIHIARKVNLCDPDKPFRLARLDDNSGALIWTDPDSRTPEEAVDAPICMDDAGLSDEQTCPSGRLALEEALTEYPEELAITGSALDFLEKHQPKLLARLLLRIRVFGRVRPMQKVQIVEWHMARGLCTAMCGDGGNDCGALKAAHVGVALSEAEASIVAPFCAGSKSPAACEVLVREGCAALSTTFALLRYLVATGMAFTLMKATLLINCLAFVPGVVYGLFDLYLHPMFCACITHCRAAQTLTRLRPPSSLFSVGFLGIYLAQVIANAVLLCGAWWIITHAQFKRFSGWQLKDPATGDMMPFHRWWKFVDTGEGTVLWTFMSSALMSVAVTSCHGGVFRAPFYRNKLLYLTVALAAITPMLCIWGGPSDLSCLFRTMCDKDGAARAARIPFAPLIAKEFWEEGFNAPGGSNILEHVDKTRITILFVATFVVHQLIAVVHERVVFGVRGASPGRALDESD